MAGSKSTSSELILELIRIISKPAFKRTDREVDLVLPWLRKRSQLLQNQEVPVVADIVKNCTILSCNRDDVIIKQGDIGDCFYIVLRGTVSVYIDPKMTGESDDTRSQASAKKKKPKPPPKAPEPEDSVLSGMEKPSTEGDETSTVTDLQTQVDDQEVIEDDDVDGARVKTRKKKATGPLDRNKFGKMICEYGPGNAFGELALVNRESRRNASVIVDEDTDLMVIDQDLFDRSLRGTVYPLTCKFIPDDLHAQIQKINFTMTKLSMIFKDFMWKSFTTILNIMAEQEAKYAEIRAFIEEHPFFCQMSTKFKKLLEMSLRKEHYIFDTNIIKQGDPVIGLHFMISGSANISIQPKKHTLQYQHLWPFEAGYDQLSIEFEHLRQKQNTDREMRRAAILRKYEDPSVWETKPEELVIRREQGYAAIEKKMKENHINLCSVQEKEVLGDVETLVNLSTYMQTVRCTSNTTCFVLDQKNFERLVGKKNNPQTMDVMREYVKSKLHTRMNMRNADLIPLLGYLHQKLTEQLLPPARKVEPFKTSKAPPDVDEEMQHLLQYFKEGKDVVLIKPCEPGVVYYRELMREKAKNRETQRKAGKLSDSIKIGPLHRTRQQRKPRSMLQIRESLRQMMEAEVIEMETKKFRKKKSKLNKDPRDPMVASQSSIASTIGSTPRTLIGSQNSNTLPDEHRANRNTKPSLMEMMKALKDKKDNEDIADYPDYGSVNGLESKKLAPKQNLPKSTPPVLVTEMVSAKVSDPSLPAIREEKTQEEIVLKTDSNSNLNTSRLSVTDKTIRESTPKPTNESASSFKDDNCIEPKKLHNSIKTPTDDKTSGRKSGNKTPTSLPPIKTPNTPKEVELELSKLTPEPSIQARSSITKLPDIGASQESLYTGRTDETSSSQSSKWQTALTFVNQRINERLRKSILEEETEYKDFETSEPSLKLLESRIRAFHVKYGMGNKTKNLPHLKRYKLDENEENKITPKPGGKVWVKKQMCKFLNSEYVVKDHKHVRYQMVKEIPEFERVKKSRVVVQQMLKTADFGENEMF